MLHPRILRVEGQRNECLEPAGLVLQCTQLAEMINAVLCLLDVSVQHRGVRAQAQLMSRPVNVDPAGRVGFVFADLFANRLVEDLRPAARQAAEPRLSHLLQRPLVGLLGQMGEPVDFDSGPGLDVNLRPCFMDDPDQIHIPVELLEMVQPADHVDLGRATRFGFEHSLANHVIGEDVRLV